MNEWVSKFEYALIHKSDLNLIESTRINKCDLRFIRHTRIRKSGFNFNEYARLNKFLLNIMEHVRVYNFYPIFTQYEPHAKPHNKSELIFELHKHAMVH